MKNKTESKAKKVLIAPNIAEMELHFRTLPQKDMEVARLNWYALSALLENHFHGICN